MKQIFVQAQADHIESLFKGSPLAAIEELVWNALDADAKEVKVDLITNALGAVEAVRVTDDGTGIDGARNALPSHGPTTASSSHARGGCRSP